MNNKTYVIEGQMRDNYLALFEELRDILSANQHGILWAWADDNYTLIDQSVWELENLEDYEHKSAHIRFNRDETRFVIGRDAFERTSKKVLQNYSGFRFYGTLCSDNGVEDFLNGKEVEVFS